MSEELTKQQALVEAHEQIVIAETALKRVSELSKEFKMSLTVVLPDYNHVNVIDGYWESDSWSSSHY